ncbi:hypothetical protein RI129_002212 [Pyrocoelia pectoralis]|uniref:Uncharacterized protein n=1 Tax=Pyrocoelia pectoralis TaxID=417401 RepID=A0AAN7VEW0_9COLE
MDNIKCRFQDSKSIVEFLASKTWVNTSHSYQRANQELFAKEDILQDDVLRDSPTPLTVRDVIPSSKLAQYCNSEYDESREQCYRNTPRTLTIFCSCVNEGKISEEPWMLPEVEESFVSLTYSDDVEVIELVQFEKSHECKLPNSYQKFPFYSAFCESGMFKYNTAFSLSDYELAKHKPTELKVNTFEEMILRLKIREVKEERILTSPLGNPIAIEKKSAAEGQINSDWVLDDDTIRTLKKHCFDFEKFSVDSNRYNKESESNLKIPTPTTRRLYSDVLQGLGESRNKDISVDQQAPFTPLIEESILPHSQKKLPDGSHLQEAWVEQSGFLAGAPQTSTGGFYSNFCENVSVSANSSQYSYGNTYCAHSYGNVYMNCPNSHNLNVHGNNYLHKGLTSNVYQGSNVYQNSTYTPLNKQPYSSNVTCSKWFVPQNRNPPVYSMTQYASQPLLYLTTQQSRTNQHYPIFYLRTPNLPSYQYSQAPQQWVANSTQQFSPSCQTDGTKSRPVCGVYKMKTKTPPEGLSCGCVSLIKRHMSCEFPSPDKKITVKPTLSTSSLEYRRMKTKTQPTKTEKDAQPASDSNRILPVARSLSEDLERQALEQYQNSDENLYQELEKQAEEQYDDDQLENCLVPPSHNQQINRRKNFNTYCDLLTK